MIKRVMAALAGVALLHGGTVMAFGFDMGDSFGEGFDFNEGKNFDAGGSNMSWESPDNVWDTGTTTHKGFSWGGGPRSGPAWGFRDAPPPPPVYRSYPYNPYRMPPPPYGYGQPQAPAAPPVYSRPPAPAAPSNGE